MDLGVTLSKKSQVDECPFLFVLCYNVKHINKSFGELFILLVVKVSGCKIAHFPLLFFPLFPPFEIILIMYVKCVCVAFKVTKAQYRINKSFRIKCSYFPIIILIKKYSKLKLNYTKSNASFMN